MTENNDKRQVRVIVCRPGEKPTIEEIGDDLASMQAVVGGMIEEYQPFYDERDPRIENVTIYCHEEGKLRNLERNRFYDTQRKGCDGKIRWIASLHSQ